MSINYKEHYDKMLASGMFFEWNPTLSGEWEKDYAIWIEKYAKPITNEIKDVLQPKYIVDLPMPNYVYELEQIQDRLENIIDALQNAIEKGNDLHLGIVVGQTLSQLKDIARR